MPHCRSHEGVAGSLSHLQQSHSLIRVVTASPRDQLVVPALRDWLNRMRDPVSGYASTMLPRILRSICAGSAVCCMAGCSSSKDQPLEISATLAYPAENLEV
jgi:hypothetical protein